MRVAVVSDIHSNLHALEAVLAAIDADAPDELWCLGDLVGYGARPNECCAAIEARAAICLAGNHDLAVSGTIDLTEFSGDAGQAAAWTRECSTSARRAFLAGLEPQGKQEGVDLYHGSARDPIWEYVLSDEAAEATLDADRGSARPRRAQPCRARRRPARRHGRRRARRRRARRSTSRRAAAC